MKELSEKNKGFYKSHIPYASDVEKIGLTREPLAVTSPNSTSAKAYASLWNEIWSELK